jgi:hypothetical protein
MVGDPRASDVFPPEGGGGIRSIIAPRRTTRNEKASMSMIETEKVLLIRRAIAVLTRLGLKVVEVRPRRDEPEPHVDAVIRVGRGKDGEDHLVGTVRSVTPQALGVMIARLRQRGKAARQPTLLVADYLTPRVAVRLRALGQSFVDGAGNVYLDAPGLLIYVMGCKPGQFPAARRPTSASTRNGLKILFALGQEPPPVCLASATTPTKRMTRSAVPGVLADLQAGIVRCR